MRCKSLLEFKLHGMFYNKLRLYSKKIWSLIAYLNKYNYLCVIEAKLTEQYIDIPHQSRLGNSSNYYEIPRQA